jgi:hypothetical protein
VAPIDELRADIWVLKAWRTSISLIAADFPALFAEFRGRYFTLLWRGTHDRFGAGEFHGRCDGHGLTLTLIEDNRGSIFGGFTPVKWGSSNRKRADPSLKSFLLTLKNPHNLPVRKFPLKAEKKDEAIYCLYFCGPHFLNICVSGSGNTNVDGFSHLGSSYANDTCMDGQTVFTNSPKSSRSPTKPPFQILLACRGNRDSREI